MFQTKPGTSTPTKHPQLSRQTSPRSLSTPMGQSKSRSLCLIFCSKILINSSRTKSNPLRDKIPNIWHIDNAIDSNKITSKDTWQNVHQSTGFPKYTFCLSTRYQGQEHPRFKILTEPMSEKNNLTMTNKRYHDSNQSLFFFVLVVINGLNPISTD